MLVLHLQVLKKLSERLLGAPIIFVVGLDIGMKRLLGEGIVNLRGKVDFIVCARYEVVSSIVILRLHIRCESHGCRIVGLPNARSYLIICSMVVDGSRYS